MVIGHHVKADDPLFVLMAAGRMIHYLAGDANMDTPWKRVLFNAMGMIPFKKKRSDMKSIRKLTSLVKEGEAIGLYPEGGRNWDGATDAIIPSTAKLIKMLGIDVYVTFYKGGYLTNPRWSDYGRRGKLEFSGFRLFEASELKTMKADVILARMSEALAYNEYDWQRSQMIPFKGKNRAESIQRLLYKCPECHSYNTIKSEGHHFYCDKCQSDYTINEYGFIEGCDQFDNTHDWHLWQHSFIPTIADEMTTYELNDIRFEIRHTKTKERSIHPASNVQISKDTITIKYGDTVKSLAISDTFGYSYTLLDLFEFFTTDYKYRLIFEPKKHLSNVFIIDLLYQLKENSKHE